MKIIANRDQHTFSYLSRLFSNAAAESFETTPFAATALPVHEDVRPYVRLAGEKNENGTWNIREEFFYAQGDTTPESPKATRKGEEWKNVSHRDAVALIYRYPRDFPDLW